MWPTWASAERRSRRDSLPRRPGRSDGRGVRLGARLFFTLYYFLTGLHALHVIGGMVFLGLMIRPVWRRRYTERHHVAVENGVLYWHLVDLVWIFLWPLLYLVG